MGCLEATYEESKLKEDELGGQAHRGLEATYEESKRVHTLLPVAPGGGLEATYEESKLGEMGSGGELGPGLEATYEESKQGGEGVPELFGGGLEATYEESKPVLGRGRCHAPTRLEATYEESKPEAVPAVVELHGHVWKLPMSNPSESFRTPPVTSGPVWKLPMRNPSPERSVLRTPAAVVVWKLPMRNPSSAAWFWAWRMASCLESTYEESKRVQGQVAVWGEVVWKLLMRNPSSSLVCSLPRFPLVWKLPMRNPSSSERAGRMWEYSSLEATYEESKLRDGEDSSGAVAEFGSYL